MTPEDKVRQHMKSKYRVNLDDLELANTPGYWIAKEAKIHKGHPLHGCIGCGGPFRATYTFFDRNKDSRGRFASPYRTWNAMKNQH